MKHKTLSNAFRKAGYEVKYEPDAENKLFANCFVEDGLVIAEWRVYVPEQSTNHVYIVNRLEQDKRFDLIDHCPGIFQDTIKGALKWFARLAIEQSSMNKPEVKWRDSWYAEKPERGHPEND
jgi:hypothetical protein